MALGAAAISDAEAPLLDDTVEGSVDFKGRPVSRSKSGGWKSASFIIGVEVAERFAYYGISSNLISYLTGPLGQSTATAAESVNVWSGTASLLPLLGGFLADTLLGRYRMVIVASIVYILGLGCLSLSALIYSSDSSDSPSQLQIILFFFSLYIVALAQGGHKPCVQAFGADQFDEQDPEECKAKSSFFNWWYFSFCAGVLVALCVLNYIQDNLSWVLGFGIPCIVMCIALIVFSLGTYTYRFRLHSDERSPFLRISQVFVRAARNWQTTTSAISMEAENQGILPYEGFQQYKFLNKALVTPDGLKQDGKVCSITDIEEAKSILRLVPIWATCLVYAVVFSQSSTLFTKQGVTMDRYITPTFQVPAASLQSVISLSIVIFIPVYDRVLVPIARALSRKPSGISMLQRIGTGIFLSLLSMVIAALVERKRLETAIEYGLVDMPKATVPMSVWWLTPQYLLFGVSDVFTMIGLQEFFYDQVPSELRSIGLALYLSIFGIGSFISSFLISVIERATGGQGHDSWFSDNLNRAHLDYFYWLLAGLMVPFRSADEAYPDMFDILSTIEDSDKQEDDEFELLDSTYWKSDRGDKVLVNVDAFGAVGDGVSDDTEAFVNAWKQACSTPKSVLLVPEERRYLVNATRFKGPCADKIIVQIDGTIVAPDDPKNWDPKNPRIWLGFYNLNRSVFQGNGVIDGSGSKWWADSCKRNKSNALTISSSTAVRVKGLTIQNSQQMNFVITRSDSVRVTGVKVSAPGDSPNTDGIHITGSTNVVLQNCKIGTGDDCISIVNGSSNIKMKNIYCGPGHGISIGSLGKNNSTGIVEIVDLDTAFLRDATNGLRIKTWQGGSGYVRSVRYQNVRMENVSNPIIIDQFYCDSPKTCKNQSSAIAISQIMYLNISGTSRSQTAMKFACSDAVPCTDIVLNDIDIQSKDGTVETYCNSASGFYFGYVHPSAECLSSSNKDMIISPEKEAEPSKSSRQYLVHTEL
ncbi:protein NRT1/ PTR FAMILY 5.10 [Sesamum alatum]|uniref:endo-polygalacturonase n=1 Tax=Sesamum alatum TaxID=300844 RepID=A0AAE2C8Y0_9LAMI|nr:protein NRT1/ PTR FAMILY 5.10 [Sesamum alatum]